MGLGRRGWGGVGEGLGRGWGELGEGLGRAWGRGWGGLGEGGWGKVVEGLDFYTSKTTFGKTHSFPRQKLSEVCVLLSFLGKTPPEFAQKT